MSQAGTQVGPEDACKKINFKLFPNEANSGMLGNLET